MCTIIWIQKMKDHRIRDARELFGNHSQSFKTYVVFSRVFCFSSSSFSLALIFSCSSIERPSADFGFAGAANLSGN